MSRLNIFMALYLLLKYIMYTLFIHKLAKNLIRVINTTQFSLGWLLGKLHTYVMPDKYWQICQNKLKHATKMNSLPLHETKVVSMQIKYEDIWKAIYTCNLHEVHSRNNKRLNPKVLAADSANQNSVPNTRDCYKV